MSDGQEGVQNPGYQGLGVCGIIADSPNVRRMRNHFDSLRPLIIKAIELMPTHSIEDIWHGIITQQFQLWPTEKSVLITELVQYPLLKNLRVFIVAGDKEEILSVEPYLVEYAKAQGCSYVEFGGGRIGWERIGKKLGYKVVCPVMVKPVE